MVDIDWTEPPAARGRSGYHYFTDTVREALRERPGVWARIATDRTSSNAALTRRNPEFEFTSRSRFTPEGRRWDIYARYVGKAAA